jgi:AraC-like DNA-binding protein
VEQALGETRIVLTSRDRNQFLAGLPVQESESIQLGPGIPEYRSKRIYGRDLIILSYRLAPAAAVHTLPEKDWATLLLPLNAQSEFVFNGRVAEPLDLFLSAGPDGYVTTGKDRCNIAIGVRKSRLVSACSALADVSMEDVLLRDLVLPQKQDAKGCLRRALIGAAKASEYEFLSQGQFTMEAALENDLTSMLAAQLVPAMLRVPEVNYVGRNALHVVHTAIAASKALPAPGLADLCAATDVSQRWLHKCFMDVLGVSPYQYIRLARLAKARELLLMHEPTTPTLIKSISLSVGYRLSGRFAKEYRSVYGENPSDTLRRSRQV